MARRREVLPIHCHRDRIRRAARGGGRPRGRGEGVEDGSPGPTHAVCSVCCSINVFSRIAKWISEKRRQRKEVALFERAVVVQTNEQGSPPGVGTERSSRSAGIRCN